MAAKDNFTRLGNNPLFRKDTTSDISDIPENQKNNIKSDKPKPTPLKMKSTKLNRSTIDVDKRIEQLRQYYGQPLNAEIAISQLLRRTTFSFTECGSDVCRLISDVCRDVSGKKVDNLQHSFVVNVALFLMLDLMEKDSEWVTRLKQLAESGETLSPEIISVYLYHALKSSI